MSLVPRLPAHAESTIQQFLRGHASGEGVEGVVIGLSGGIDSALTARLARDALGASAVLGVLLPDRSYPDPLRKETEGFARDLGIETQTVPIETLETPFHSSFPEVSDRLTWGNVKARLRMIVLYTISRERRRRVVGTGNKSEILLGYFTKYGDGGADLIPIGDLYKTQVGELAEALELPRVIRDRPPTAGLWEGQTDEAELGLPYHDIDQILFGLEQLRTEEEIAKETKLPLDTVRGVAQRVSTNRHKRRVAPIPKIGLRTVGIDWRD